MTVIVIDEAYIIGELNTLPPNSRKRDGLTHVLRHLKRLRLAAETEEQSVHRLLVSELETALADVPQWQRERIRESF